MGQMSSMSTDQALEFKQLLEGPLASPSLLEVAHKAIAAVSKVDAPVSTGMAEQPQSSKDVAKTYALRRDIGYFGQKSIYGLAETIASLSSEDCLVTLCYMQLPKALVSIWVGLGTHVVHGVVMVEHA